MTETNNQLSTEVVGQYSASQQEELSIIGSQIVRSLNYDPKDPDRVQEVRDLISDCIYRGLEQTGRRWFLPHENCAPTFNLGLTQREQIAKDLKDHSASIDSINYLSQDDVEQIRRMSATVTPFTLDLSETEAKLEEIKEKQKNVDQFHALLFDQSTLAPDATRLRNLARGQEGTRTAPVDIHHSLYANFLVNLALYRKPGLVVEPKDIAALIDLWKDEDAKKQGQESLVESIKELAGRSKLSEEAIETYTRRILEKVNMYLGKNVDLETIRDSRDFIILPEDIEEEQREFVARAKSVEIPQSEVEKARGAFEKTHNLFLEFVKEAEELPEDQETPQPMVEQYMKSLGEITPLETIYLWRDVLTKSGKEEQDPTFEHDLVELIPTETYVSALSLAYAGELRVKETGELIPDLNPRNIDVIRSLMKNHVIKGLLEETTPLEDTFEKLPIPVASEYLRRVNPQRLAQAHKETILELATAKWISLCIESGVEYSEGNLVFSPDSEMLRPLIQMLPPEKRTAVTSGVRRVVTF